MEKLKDLIHDYTDIILAIVIALSMFFVVNWHLGSWLPSNSTVVVANTNNNSDFNTDNLNTIVEKEDEDWIEETEQDIEEEEEEEEEEEITQEPEASSENEITVVDNVSITIPNGSTGQAIGRILKEYGLIEEVSDFISESERLNLTSRLQSGTFQIPENASIEQLVKIIAKQL